eukprot:8645608-Pyramimonas_sp.AAC.1
MCRRHEWGGIKRIGVASVLLGGRRGHGRAADELAQAAIRCRCTASVGKRWGREKESCILSSDTGARWEWGSERGKGMQRENGRDRER